MAIAYERRDCVEGGRMKHTKEPCPYCKNEFDNKKVDVNEFISAFIINGELLVTSDTVEIFIPINYCPMCGRKLGGAYEV